MDYVRDYFAAQPPRLLWGLSAVLGILTLGLVAAFVLPLVNRAKDYTNLRQRVVSWWVMVALLAGALLVGWGAVVVLFAVISFIALREFLSLAPIRPEDRLVVLVAYLSIPLSYGFIAVQRYGIFLVFIPVWVFLLTPYLMAIIGQTRGYLTTAAIFHWGIVTCVYNLGHVAFLMHTPVNRAGPAGPAGVVFLLLVATELNDVAQYVWGKLFGRHKIIPKVSPNKTWEGFLGGWITTSLLIWFGAPFFMPIQGWGLFWIAASLPLAGFAGDVTMSAIKRDIGVKDTSAFIPGHGGVLDRLDSLTFTAPLFFHLFNFFNPSFV